MLILMCTADGAASIRRSATVPQGSMLLAQFTVHCLHKQGVPDKFGKMG